MTSLLTGLAPSREAQIQLFAGGAAGTTGAIITCPLEVVKTRLQSSNSGFRDVKTETRAAPPPPPSAPQAPSTGSSSGSRATMAQPTAIFDKNHQNWRLAMRFSTTAAAPSAAVTPPKPSPGFLEWWECIKYIKQTEGMMGLYKGLGPNIVGVAPSRAIYFWAYSTAKRQVNASLPKRNRDTPLVHVLSAAMAGFTASTLTNPIWLVKTRLQLDRRSGDKTLTVRQCISNIITQFGVRGLWKGVTASYWGICETMIHWMVYEYLKKQLAEYRARMAALNPEAAKEQTIDWMGLMGCGACSRLCATAIAYPHEVARTRLREGDPRYRKFWQTIFTVYREEGRRGLYRGMVTQLCRQVPNTAIMMGTYEVIVYGLHRWWKDPSKPVSSSSAATAAAGATSATSSAKRLSNWETSGSSGDAKGASSGSKESPSAAGSAH